MSLRIGLEVHCALASNLEALREVVGQVAVGAPQPCKEQQVAFISVPIPGQTDGRWEVCETSWRRDAVSADNSTGGLVLKAVVDAMVLLDGQALRRFMKLRIDVNRRTLDAARADGGASVIDSVSASFNAFSFVVVANGARFTGTGALALA